MERITQIIIGLMFTVGGTFSAFAQSDNNKIVEQIMKREAEHIEASKKLSAEDFDRMETDDFMMTVRIPPKIVTKAENSAKLKDPKFKRGTIESLTNDHVKVRVYNNDTAISTGSWKRTSKDADGKDTSAAGRFTHVWVKQNGKWRLAAAHYSPNIDLEKLKSGNTPTENKKKLIFEKENKMPIDLSIISAGNDTSGFLPAVRNLRNDLPNPIDAFNVSAMVNEMLDRCGGQTHSIRSVRIFGHGAAGCQFIGCGNERPTFDEQKLGLNPANKTLYNQASLRLLRGYFAENGCVVLHGCNVAEGTVGQMFLEKLAMLWQVSVSASEDRQTNELSGNQPLNPLSGRIRQILFNLPNHAPFRRRGFSVSYSSVSGTPETPLH